MDRPTALDPFGQVGSADEGHAGGTGLGPLLTKGLVLLHDGTPDIASEVGIGTIVTIRFPRAIPGWLELLQGRDRGPPALRRARAGADPRVRCRERQNA